MKIKAGDKTYELGVKGCLRWNVDAKNPIYSFHVAQKSDGSIEVYVPAHEKPYDIDDGATEVGSSCTHCGSKESL